MLYIFLIIYSIIIISIGVLVGKESSEFENYFLAGKSLSWKSFGLTMSATWFGASSILVLTDESFRNGVSSIWIMTIPSLLTLFLFYLFSDKIRKSNIFSIPEILKNSYGKFFQFIASITIFFYLLLLSSSQAVALGKIIEDFSGLDYKVSLISGIIFVFLYSFRGGLISVVRTDFLQLFTVFLGLLLIIISLTLIAEKNGITFDSQSVPKDFFNPFKNLSYSLIITFSFTLAWFISPVAWQRIVASKSDGDAKKGLLLTSLLLFLLFSLPISIGIFERFILANKPSYELIIFVILNNQLNRIFSAIAFLAIFSAVVSTLDSILNVSAMTLTSDIGKVIFKGKILKGRLSLTISTFFTLLFSIPLEEILLGLGLSSQFLVCGLFVPLIFSMVLKRTPEIAGIFSLFSGLFYSMASYLKSGLGLKIPIPFWPQSTPLGILISLFFFLLGIGIDRIKKGFKPSLPNNSYFSPSLEPYSSSK